ncbi:MAG: SDR family oxidoreductase [Candidatus Thermoplasmatota archaeon]|nr:SDR family oxidoreductase [Candidatus Thermoplasmatota archaeon]
MKQIPNKSQKQINIHNSTCLVTGGAGFIGSHLVDALSKSDLQNNIIIIDNLSTGKLENIAHHFTYISSLRELLKNNINKKKPGAYANPIKREEQKEELFLSNNHISFIKADITDIALLHTIFQKYKPRFVFHQAAVPSVPRSVKEPIKSHNTNVNGTLNVLVASKEVHVKKVVYASSSSVYGNTPTLPKKEEMTPSPLSPYAVNKLSGEYYCKVFNECYGLPTVSLRYFNVYGPRQDPNSEYAAVIPKFITRILENKPPVIYGDGMQTRDFSFVADVVQANIKAATSDAIGVFNVASGKQISIRELSESVSTILEKESILVYKDKRTGDVKHSLADISKSNQAFGYHPKYAMQQGLEETISWFKQSRSIENMII